jgi:hypothetical protein
VIHLDCRKHLVEKFSLTADRQHLKYEFVLEGLSGVK